jgi:hypothetical protein
MFRAPADTSTAKRPIENTSEERRLQEYRGLATRARVVVSREDRAWMRSNARVLAPLSLRLSITVLGP